MNSRLFVVVVFVSLVFVLSLLSPETNAMTVSSARLPFEGPMMDVGKRSSNRRCVRCKLGIANCCEPDICVKRTLRPDKCLSVKPGK